MESVALLQTMRPTSLVLENMARVWIHRTWLRWNMAIYRNGQMVIPYIFSKCRMQESALMVQPTAN